ncbi:profilin [Streptomyces fuscigenes]|uniref:profilin n=1 Tax=Streptomyces fuscigenes TaxID=1528880 RepID=UPI001F3A33DC|nr:profilin [Streptomyces fuscigenes]MCF3962762.1 profilin [Streptomyces fuscigenes]
MSDWQQYVDERLVGTNNVRNAAIIGADDGGTWAESDENLLKPGEAEAIVALFKDPEGVRESSVVVGGEKYTNLIGRGSSVCAKKGADGVTMTRTDRAVIVAVYEEGQAPCAALAVTENLAETLREKGY